MTTAHRFTRRTITQTALGAVAITAIAPTRAIARQATPSASPVSGRTVETTFGTVTVPAEITSVVVIEGRRDLDIALALDLPVVGYPESAGVSASSPLLPALESAIANGAEALFVEDETDIEAILAVHPSLILCRDEDLAENDLYARLSAIAPVLPVASTATGVRWQDDFAFVADAVGATARHDEVIAEFTARFAEVQTTNVDVWSAKVVPLSYNENGMQFLSNRLLSQTLGDLGATFSSSAAPIFAEGGRESYSLEQVQEAVGDADGVFILVNEDSVFETWLNDPLWQTIPAIAAGHYVRSDKFTHDGGPITALHCLDVIDALYATLREGESSRSVADDNRAGVM